MKKKALGQKTEQKQKKNITMNQKINTHRNTRSQKKHETLRNGNNKRIIKILKKYHR